ncbi:hypothetical protein FCZ50_20035 [Escherichia coli]|nr:hypothetical protein [Escherichia coli]
MANDATPYLMVLLLNNDVWCKSREVVVLRNLIEQAWGKVLDEDNSVTHPVVYPEVLSLVFDAANTYNWICPYISRHLLSLNPLLACCRRYSRGER